MFRDRSDAGSPSSERGITRRRVLLGGAAGLVGAAITQYERESPTTPVQRPGSEYATTRAFADRQKYLWIPKGADGRRPVVGGFSDSQALVDIETSHAASPFPARRFESDPQPFPAASFRIADAGDSEMKTAAGLSDVTSQPYDVVLLPLPVAMLALGTDGALTRASTNQSDATRLLAMYQSALLELRARANRTRRQIEVVSFVPGITIAPGVGEWSEYAGRSDEVLARVSDILHRPLDGDGGAGGLSLSSQFLQARVSRTWADRISSEFIDGGHRQVSRFYADADRSNQWPIWVHVGGEGTEAYSNIVRGEIADAVLRVKAARRRSSLN